MSIEELGNAAIQKNLKTAQELQSSGIEMEKSWSTCDDDKDCELCTRNQKAGWIPLDKAFPSGHQTPLAHDECRCDLLTRVKVDEPAKIIDTPASKPSQTSRLSRKTLNIILIAIPVLCLLCFACNFILQTYFPSTPSPIITKTPAPTSTIPPTISPAQTYLDEYGGVLASYQEIFDLTDCTLLQEKFEVAYENNQRETPGTPLFKVTLGYMTATDDHMKAIGCYTSSITSLSTSTFTPYPTNTPFLTATLPAGCYSAYPEFCIPINTRPSCDQLPSNFVVLPPDPQGYDGDNDGIGCEN